MTSAHHYSGACKDLFSSVADVTFLGYLGNTDESHEGTLLDRRV